MQKFKWTTVYILISDPPNPSSILWFADTHNSTRVTWTVDDYSDAQNQNHPDYGKINTTIYLYVNGELHSTLPEDYSSREHVFIDLPNPKTAYTCEVAIGLTCPDDKVNLDEYDYGSYSVAYVGPIRLIYFSII